MAAIPGIPGGAEPSFRSGHRGWISLDELVHEVVAWLATDGNQLSPYVVKAVLQVTRRLVDAAEQVVVQDLFADVHRQVRHQGVLLQEPQVESVIRAYAAAVAILEIQDVAELPL